LEGLLQWQPDYLEGLLEINFLHPPSKYEDGSPFSSLLELLLRIRGKGLCSVAERRCKSAAAPPLAYLQGGPSMPRTTLRSSPLQPIWNWISISFPHGVMRNGVSTAVHGTTALRRRAGESGCLSSALALPLTARSSPPAATCRIRPRCSGARLPLQLSSAPAPAPATPPGARGSPPAWSAGVARDCSTRATGTRAGEQHPPPSRQPPNQPN